MSTPGKLEVTIKINQLPTGVTTTPTAGYWSSSLRFERREQPPLARGSGGCSRRSKRRLDDQYPAVGVVVTPVGSWLILIVTSSLPGVDMARVPVCSHRVRADASPASVLS